MNIEMEFSFNLFKAKIYSKTLEPESTQIHVPNLENSFLRNIWLCKMKS